MRNPLVLLLLFALYHTTVNSATAIPTPCQANGLAGYYDVIIVGGGLGGSVSARRLAEMNPTWNILQIERGIPYSQCSTCQLASTTGAPYLETNSGGYVFSTPQYHGGLNGTVFPIKDPAVQGGGTSVNGVALARGDAWRYFPEYYPANWNWQLMENFYLKYENYTYPAGFYGGNGFSYAANNRSNSGPVEVDQQPLRPFEASYLNVIKQVYPNMPVYTQSSINDGNFPGVGASPVETTSSGDLRVSAYTAYIRTYTGTNLKTITNSLVTKILFSGTAASGVNITYYNITNPAYATSYCTLNTSRVIVAAGAFGTPKILKLSGVGPAAELQKNGIPVVANLSQVGANLNDHFVLYTTYKGYKDNLVNNNYPDQIANTFYNAADNGPLALNDFAYNLAKTPTPGVIDLSTSRTNMNSGGSVTLASADPRAAPVIDLNYFADPADVNASAVANFKLRQMGVLLNLTASPDPCANQTCNTPQTAYNAYVNKNAVSVGYHFTSTAALCSVTNPLSLRVQGTSGLYVLDASIMPRSPACNTQGSLYAVAEYGSLLININMHLDSTGQQFEEILGQAFCGIENFANME